MFKELKNSYGNQFQDLFTKLMKKKYGHNYQSTSTNGNIGDLGVDGILNINQIIAFAVYAPEVYTETKAIHKIKSDFNNFIKQRENGYWQYISSYIFVIKRQRIGVTPKVLDLITNLNNNYNFKVGIMTLDDLEEQLIFFDNKPNFQYFKYDVVEIMEYIVRTDFSAQPIDINFPDKLSEIIEKWTKISNTFSKKELEILKNDILKEIYNLSCYLTPKYVHVHHNGYLLFNNDSKEAGDLLRNELRPETLKIRKRITKLLEKIYTY